MRMEWEERMAAKARRRADKRAANETLQSNKEWEELQEEYVSSYAAALTPESAAEEQRLLDENPYACACVGGPFCCHIRYLARMRVLQGEE